MSNGYIFVADGQPHPRAQIINNLFDLFKAEVEAGRVAGMLPYESFLFLPNHLLSASLLTTSPPCGTAPIDDGQKIAWLRCIVPKIESAYEVEVYTHTPERLERALNQIREFCRTINIDADRLINEIMNGD